MRSGLVDELRHERPSHPAAPGLRPHVEVLEVEAEPARPGGVVEEVDGHAEHVPSVVGDVGEDHRVVGEEGVTQQSGVDLDRIGCTFVGGQVADELHEGGDVLVGGRTDDHGTSRTRPNAWRLSM